MSNKSSKKAEPEKQTPEATEVVAEPPEEQPTPRKKRKFEPRGSVRNIRLAFDDAGQMSYDGFNNKIDPCVLEGVPGFTLEDNSGMVTFIPAANVTKAIIHVPPEGTARETLRR